MEGHQFGSTAIANELINLKLFSEDDEIQLGIGATDFYGRCSRNLMQHTVPYCTRCAHDGFYLIDFIVLSVLSIMGMI